MALKKITLEVGKKTIELNPEEAKELKHILCELFGSEIVVKEVHHHDRWWPNYWTSNIVYCNTPHQQISTDGSNLTFGSIQASNTIEELTLCVK